jgi:catechol 2,3-dioxygenase-like lactoylglutathione lyase family enzyme
VTRLTASAVRVFVADLQPAVAFYRDVLRLPLLAEGPVFALFDGGGVNVVVEVGDRDESGRPLVGRFTGLSFNAPDAAAEHERLQAPGVRLHGPPEAQDWGGLLLTFEDPAGNELQIVQYPD